MKFIRFSLQAGVCALALALGTTAFAQSTPGYATIIRLDGQARYSADGGTTWHPVVIGQVLTAGSVIQTAAGSTADLVLGDKMSKPIATPNVAPAPDSAVRGVAGVKSAAEQNVIHMDSDTVLAIDKLTVGNTGVDAVSDTELDLRQGSIFGNVKKLSATSQYLIKMPNGIAGVRGTTFMLNANGDVTVISGSMVVSVTGRDGKTSTVVLGPGDSYNPRTGSIVHLNPVQLHRAERHARYIITVDYGITIYARDHTIIHISPTTGA